MKDWTEASSEEATSHAESATVHFVAMKCVQESLGRMYFATNATGECLGL
jgi:hypothetical protein